MAHLKLVTKVPRYKIFSLFVIDLLITVRKLWRESFLIRLRYNVTYMHYQNLKNSFNIISYVKMMLFHTMLTITDRSWMITIWATSMRNGEISSPTTSSARWTNMPSTTQVSIIVLAYLLKDSRTLYMWPFKGQYLKNTH